MNSSMSFAENSDIELFENFLKLSNISKNSNKELKKVKEEKEFSVIQLSKSYALIDSLKYENTIFFKTFDSIYIK